MIKRHGLSFDMLSDPGNEYAAALGLRYTLPDYLQGIYTEFGLDVPKHNGEDSWTLPLPARLVVDGSGIVRAADINADYTRRPEPQKTLEDVRVVVSGS
jgi:peroxiredoxin